MLVSSDTTHHPASNKLLRECSTAWSFEVILAASFAVRFVQCFLAWNYGWLAGLLGGLLQSCLKCTFSPRPW